jgi:hypothetical protein
MLHLKIGPHVGRSELAQPSPPNGAVVSDFSDMFLVIAMFWSNSPSDKNIKVLL